MIRNGQSIEGGTLYRPAFNTPKSGIPVRIDPSSFKGSAFCDANGFLVPGTPLQAGGTLATAAASPAAYVMPYAVQIAESNSDADLDAAPNGDVTARTNGDVIEKHVAGNIGRVLTANEKAAYTTNTRLTLI